MKTKLRISRHSSAGNALVTTVLVIALVGVCIDLALQYTGSVSRSAQRSLLFRQATNIGDAATEMSFSSWRAICRTTQTKVFASSSFSALPSPSPSNFPGVAKYTLSNYTVTSLDSYWSPKATSTATPAPIAGPNHGDLSYYYLATADVVVPTMTAKNITDPNDAGTVTARVRRVFQKEILSLWRYAAFFDDDLEIHPGATMNINGDVHTNASLYTGHNLLNLAGKTTYADDWSIGFATGDGNHSGETPQSPTWTGGSPPTSDQAQEPYGVYLSDYHELIDYTTSPTALDPYRFQTQADYVITIDNSNNIKIYNGSGTDVTTKADGTALKATIATNQTIVDNREGATTGNSNVRVATVDIAALTTAIKGASISNSTTMIYVVDTSAVLKNTSLTYDASTNPYDPAKKRAIRLKNGGTLPTNGLTIVSGNPVYVQGDYNTGTTYNSDGSINAQPVSNTSGDPTVPTVGNYTRAPAAIVADAVTILSNSWLDSKAGTVPAAANTTINAAIVSGIVPSAGGNYSGGLENFPRFLENWSAKTVTYYGSMIELYNSRQGIGKWGAANVYNAPNRAWYFDTKFVSQPPPGLLASFNYRRSRWYLN